MFGTYGDVTKARVEVGKWTRVVVSVKCGESKENKGELRTWVGATEGVMLKEESILANERFAIDPSSLFLFSSAQHNMMPGNIAIRTVRVEMAYMTDSDIRGARARDKVIQNCM